MSCQLCQSLQSQLSAALKCWRHQSLDRLLLQVQAGASQFILAVLPRYVFQRMLHCAGLQELSRLQRLEVLQVPCTDPYAITRLATHLPALRSLELWCSSSAGAQEEAVGQLTLAAATALTELRLNVRTQAFDTVKRLQMPPRLQVLTSGLRN